MELDEQLVRDSRIRTTAMVILTFIAVAVALYFLRGVLMPFVLALFIASGLVPLLNAVQSFLELSRSKAILVTGALSIFAVFIMWLVIGFSVQELWDEDGQYRAGFDKMLTRISDKLEDLYPRKKTKENGELTDNKRGIKTDDESDPAKETANRQVKGDEKAEPADKNTAPAEEPDLEVSDKNSKRSDEKSDSDEGETDGVETVINDMDPSEAEKKEKDRLNQFLSDRLGSIISMVAYELRIVFSSGILVMIFLFFLLLGGSEVTLPENNIWREIDAHLRRYIVTKSVISLFTGLAFGLVLWVFGVPLALVLGMLAFLLNFIPNLGPIIASVLPIPLVWVVLESTWAAEQAGLPPDDPANPGMSIFRAVSAITLAGFVQFASGNLIEPKIMGEQFRLHPIAILLALMFWYMIWGLVGAFLAVPITSALKIVFAELDSTRPAAELLEGNLSILAKRETGNH